MLGAAGTPGREAVATFASSVGSLHWSEEALDAGVAQQAAFVREAASLPVSPACQDLRAWIASGNRRLNASAHLASAAVLSLFAPLVQETNLGTSPNEGIDDVLARRESPSQRALSSRVALLSLALEEADDGRALTERLAGALGFGEEGEEGEGRSVQGRLAGRGVTADGGAYAVHVKATRVPHLHCHYVLSVSYRRPSVGLLSFEGSGGETGGDCRIDRRAKPSECEEGRIALFYLLPGDVRRVRLRLAGGAAVSSPPLRVGRDLGGPASLYYQSLPEGSPPPFALAEIGRGGRVLRILHLLHEPRCHRAAAPPSRTIAKVSAPGGAIYEIGIAASAH